MTDFNFLRIKWPKLAAIAADASRLVEVSPASAVATMQNFCEWATDIALDLYAIKSQNGTTQQEKMEALRATGNVPTEILTRMNNILVSGGRRVYHIHEDVEEARRCIDDVYEIARWLNREADRAGWPPRGGNVYRPQPTQATRSSNASNYGGGNFGPADSRLFPAEIQRSWAPLIKVGAMGVAVIALIVLIVVGVSALVRNASRDVVANISPNPGVSSSNVLEIPTDTPAEATPTPETEVYLDTVDPTSPPSKGYYRKQWKDDKPLTIGDKAYENGIGWFIPSASISQSSSSASVKYNLGGKYSKLRFDLGVDANMDYGTGYGTFRVTIYGDDDVVYDSDKQEYDYSAFETEVDLHNCDVMKIVLTEKKGDKGTINVVLGDMRLVQADGGGDEATVSDNASASNDASASPDQSSASHSASKSPTKASASPSHNSSASSNSGSQEDPGSSDPVDEEQAPPPD